MTDSRSELGGSVGLSDQVLGAGLGFGDKDFLLEGHCSSFGLFKVFTLADSFFVRLVLLKDTSLSSSCISGKASGSFRRSLLGFAVFLRNWLIIVETSCGNRDACGVLCWILSKLWTAAS